MLLSYCQSPLCTCQLFQLNLSQNVNAFLVGELILNRRNIYAVIPVICGMNNESVFCSILGPQSISTRKLFINQRNEQKKKTNLYLVKKEATCRGSDFNIHSLSFALFFTPHPFLYYPSYFLLHLALWR